MRISAPGTFDTQTLSDGLARHTRPHLVSTGWNDADAQVLTDHIGKQALHGSLDRNFHKAWRKDPKTGENRPKYYRVSSRQLERCQYAVLTSPQRSAVLVIDIDTASGKTGGNINALHPEIAAKLTTLCEHGIAPSWIGINPLNGKAQALWLIDPVYAGKGRTSANTRLMSAVTATLNRYLGGDTAFSHCFSRWPLHKSDDPLAYRWHCQHHSVMRLGNLMDTMKRINPEKPSERSVTTQQYSSGRERIEAAKRARKQAQALRELNKDLPTLEDIAPASAGLIDGVRVLWIIDGKRTARDETAFRHALATAHRLKEQGKRLKDATIIDAYERAYNVAQAVGADNREPAMPPMKDRLTMARRVRGYVTQGITEPNPATQDTRQSSAGRKALATMGRRGGQQASKRWQDPTQKEYQDAARKPLVEANQRRSYSTDENKARIQLLVSSYRRQGLSLPSTKEMAEELGLTIRRVQQLRRDLGISGKPGRPTRK